MKMKQFKSVDEYIATFPKNVQKSLSAIRNTVRKLAPEAEETFRYGIPTFRLKGNLIHYAGYERHIGLYPTSSAIKFFSKELAKYETARGTVRFPIDKPLPMPLITKIVKFRVKENLSK
jgi:uncharacterized protein YdhG (YjbR/CyaY superfamily)